MVSLEDGAKMQNAVELNLYRPGSKTVVSLEDGSNLLTSIELDFDRPGSKPLTSLKMAHIP